MKVFSLPYEEEDRPAWEAAAADRRCSLAAWMRDALNTAARKAEIDAALATKQREART